MTSTPPPETRQFNQAIQSLLRANTPQSRALLNFIHRMLYQFGLQAYFTEVDIFIEAYLRGVRYTHENRVHIQATQAWMKRTAYNIIREWKRERLRYSATALDDLIEQGVVQEAPPPLDDHLHSLKSHFELALVVQAFRQLDPCDRNLIQWRVIEGLAWKDIRERLIASGHQQVAESTLRKRGQRAIERFRQAYYQIRDQQLS